MKVDETFSNVSLTTASNDYRTTLDLTIDNRDDMTRILTFAIPSAFAAVLIVVFVAVGIIRRQQVIEKWSSIRRMKNTNPDCIDRPALRRDSEFDSTDENFVTVTIVNPENHPANEPEFQLSTIS